MSPKFKRTGSFYAYILRCSDGTYYTGYTPDIARRVILHNSGRGAKYTRARRPVELVWHKEFKYFKTAFRMERELKKLDRKRKLKLINAYLSAEKGRRRADMKFIPEEKYMRKAIQKARENVKKMEGGPFGACIVKDGRVLAVARNTVLAHDATCHAEVNAIRIASRKTGSHDLSGAVIYSTTEPCPMCFGAIHWARISTVIYGTSVKDADTIGFNELKVGNVTLKNLGKSEVKIVPDFLKVECFALMKEWAASPRKELY